jgi:hypothetical protein
MRKAELLSMATQPLLTASGANLIELSEPALKIAISRSLKASGVVSSTFEFAPRIFISRPADLAEARRRTSEAGKFLFSRRLIISWPTAPVAPTIPIRYFFNLDEFKR